MSQLTFAHARPAVAGASAAPLSGELFGALINLAGRQRMLSQRIVLHAVLASLGQDDSIQAARDTLALFRDSHASLVRGNHEMPGIFFEELRLAYFGPLQGHQQICNFMNLAMRTLDATAADYRSAPALQRELGQCATPIVDLLNRITVVYEDEARRYSHTQKKQMHELMSDIKGIAKQARIVSFNAQIVAARAGNAGREFSAVAGVLSDITGRIEDLMQVALKGAPAANG